MLSRVLVVVCTLVCFIFSGSIRAEEETQDAVVSEAPSPVVVELFSSQSCMFCPKADAHLETLAQQENIIAYSCHVDYFEITPSQLSQSVCTDRQNMYVRLLASGTNYTPQLVINGQQDVVGYELEQVDAAIKKTSQKSAVIGLEITRDEDSGDFTFHLPQLRHEREIELQMVILRTPQELKITQGINRGQTMQYVNIVRSIERMADWDGKPFKSVFAADLKADDSGLIIIAQDLQTGEIVAAAQYDISTPAP